MLGFTYCGIHSSAFGCCYAPDAAAMGGDAPAFDVEELT